MSKKSKFEKQFIQAYGHPPKDKEELQSFLSGKMDIKPQPVEASKKKHCSKKQKERIRRPALNH